MDLDKLKHKALTKLNMQSENSPFNKEQIRLVAIKDELTEADVAQLEHYVARTPRELKRTVYYGNTIIDPATWDHKLYRRNAEGKYVYTNVGENNRKDK